MTAAAQITNPAQESSRAGKKKAVEQIALERGQKQSIALNALFISARNVRKMRNSESIPELGATILAQGLLNPLIVIAEKKKGGKGKTFGVVAGGRRLMALLWLVEQGKLTMASEIQCVVIDEAMAVAVSLTENTQQESMHAADQLEAFKDLVSQGFTAGQIAAQFGVTTLTVERRLQLGNLAPQLLELFRADKIEQQQLMALALCPSQERQIEVWESLPTYSRSAYHIRQMLTQDETKETESVSLFVGVDAYIAAGGNVRGDLFADAGGRYLQDTELLMRLASEKLSLIADDFRAAGWKWVDTAMEFGYSDRSRFGKMASTTGEPSEAIKESMAAWEASIAQMSARIEELEAFEEYDEETEEYGERTPEQEAEFERLSQDLSMLEDRLKTAVADLQAWTPEQMAMGGVVVTFGAHGGVEVHKGLVRPEDRKQVASQPGGALGNGYEPATKVRAEFSASLCQNLTAHRTAAVAAGLTQNPHIALVAMLHTVLMNDRGPWSESPLKLSMSNQIGEASRNAAEFGDTQAANILEQADAVLGDHLPGEPAALFAVLQAMSTAELLEILAVFVARSYTVAAPTAKREVRGYDLAQGIESALQINMAEWWTPTPERYLSHVSKAKMQEAITEACGAEDAKTIEKMKKGEAIAAAAALLEGKGWLPPPLRSYE